jgi:hypothetical protein
MHMNMLPKYFLILTPAPAVIGLLLPVGINLVFDFSPDVRGLVLLLSRTAFVLSIALILSGAVLISKSPGGMPKTRLILGMLLAFLSAATVMPWFLLNLISGSYF